MTESPKQVSDAALRDQLEISVLVPLARDRGLGLLPIRSWTSGQTFARDRYEVLALSDGSNSELERAAGGCLGPHDRLLRQEDASDTSLWDLGARAARGHLLLFTEGHCIAEPACIAEIVAALASQPLDAVCCESIGDHSTTAAWIEDRIFQDGFEAWAGSADPRMVSLRGFAARRDDYLAVGGLSEDHDECFAERVLAGRLVASGVRIGRAPKAIVRHQPNTTFAGLKHDSDAFFRCEFSYRASAANAATAPESFLAFSPVWEQRGSYDRHLARAALRAALAMPVAALPHLPQILARAAAGPWGEIAANTIGLWITARRLGLGWPFDRGVRRAYREHWTRLAHDSSLRALTLLSPQPTQVVFPGRLAFADMPGDRLFGFYAPERDPEGRSLRWAAPVSALRLPTRADAACDVVFELHPASTIAYPPVILVDGLRIPSDRIEIGDGLLALHLERSPRVEREIAIACRPVLGATPDRRSLGLAIMAVQVEQRPDDLLANPFAEQRPGTSHSRGSARVA